MIKLNTLLRIQENSLKVSKVKGLSVVDALPFLDLATCVMPEYMHSVLLGVGKQFINIYFCKKGDWNISKHLDAIDNMLLNICPPHSFTDYHENFLYTLTTKLLKFIIGFYTIPFRFCRFFYQKYIWTIGYYS